MLIQLVNFSFPVLSHIRADRIQTFVGKCLEKKNVLTPNVFHQIILLFVLFLTICSQEKHKLSSVSEQIIDR